MPRPSKPASKSHPRPRSRRPLWRQYSALQAYAAVAATVIAAVSIVVALVDDEDRPATERTATPTPTATASGIPTPTMTSHTVIGRFIYAEGTTSPLPKDYSVYLQAIRMANNSANVSEPATIDENWKWTATVTIPKGGSYLVKAVPAPTTGAEMTSFAELTGDSDVRPTGATATDIRRALARESQWTDRYASGGTVVLVSDASP